VKRLLTGLALLVLAPVSVYLSYHPKLEESREGTPSRITRVAPGTDASYGPATWRLLDVRRTSRLSTDKWVGPAPATAVWVVARFSYRLDAAPPEEHWCEVTFIDDRDRRFEIEAVTSIAGRTSYCQGDEEHPPPAPGGTFAFTVAVLVPKDAADRVRPRVTIRKLLPAALEFG
jgi:hypothetical protein